MKWLTDHSHLSSFMMDPTVGSCYVQGSQSRIDFGGDPSTGWCMRNAACGHISSTLIASYGDWGPSDVSIDQRQYSSVLSALREYQTSGLFSQLAHALST